MTKAEAETALFEEYTDVLTCAKELGLTEWEGLAKKKKERFELRWEVYKEDKDGTR